MSRRTWLWVILGVGFLVRWGVGFWHPFWFDDSLDYVALGRAMLAGHYEVGRLYASRMPGYPALVAGVLGVFGAGSVGIHALLLMQAGLGAGCCGLVYLLGRRVSEGAGLAAAALVAVDPLGVAFSGAVLSEIPFTFLLLLAVWVMVRVWEDGRMGWWMALGAVGGAAVYVRAEAWWLMVGMGICYFIYYIFYLSRSSDLNHEDTKSTKGHEGAGEIPLPSRTLKRELRTPSPSARVCELRRPVAPGAVALGAVVAVGVLVAMLGPWWGRNWGRAETRGIGFTSLEGISLYEVVYPGADGGPRQDKPEIRAALEEMKRAGMTEGERDREWKRRAWACMRAEPGRMVRLAGVKVVRMWQPGFNAEDYRQWWVQAGMWAWHVAVYALAAVGLVVGRKRCLMWLLVGVILYFTLVHAVFMGSVRYRVPLMPLVGLLAGWGMWWVWEGWGKRWLGNGV